MNTTSEAGVDKPAYEAPTITDYGTLAELTASGINNGQIDTPKGGPFHCNLSTCPTP